MDTNRSFRDTLIRIVALIGLLLVLLLGAWGIILLAFNLPTIASNVGNSIVSIFSSTPSTPNTIAEVTVNAPQSVKSGSSFTLSWSAEDASDYEYTISYDCANGLSLKAPSANGTYQTVACNTPFNFVSASEHMTLVPSLSGANSAPMTITVSATNGSNTVVASGSTVVTVVAASTGSTNTGSTGGSTYVPANTQAQLYGMADLAVRIVSATPVGGYYGSNRVQVVFEVENRGTNIANAGWVINATLPVGYTYLYTSPAQRALYPGDKMVYTMGFNTAGQNNTQYCTMQYPNQNCPWYQAPYQPYPYQGTCYRYDGYQNWPVPCTTSDGAPIYTNPNYNTSYNYGSNYGYVYQGNLVTIQIDPGYVVADPQRSNNTASIVSPIY